MKYFLNYCHFLIFSFMILYSFSSIKIDYQGIINKIEANYSPSSSFKLPHTPILLKSWMKYSSLETQNNFYENVVFKNETQQIDKEGFINIPSKYHFFFLLTKASINILTARKEAIAKVYDIIKISDIKSNSDNIQYGGGIENYGDFEEGYCFKIIMKNDERFTICADTKQEKEKWMNSLFILKQEENTVIHSKSNHLSHHSKKIISNEIRYSKCKYKEGNMAYLLPSSYNKTVFKKTPINIVLTNKTISLYRDDAHKECIISYFLSELIEIKKLNKQTLSDDYCLFLNDGHQKIILCALYPSYNSSENEYSLRVNRDSWLNDILFFTKSCGEFYSKELNAKGAIKEDINFHQIQTELDTLSLNEKAREEMRKILTQTQELAMKALEKEIIKEELIEKEEEEREKRIEEEYNRKIDELNKQAEIIENKLSEKKKEAKYYETKSILNQKIKKITQQVKEQIEKNRIELKERIKNKKKEIDEKTNLYHKKIDELKHKISYKLYQANKRGDSEKCNPNKSIIEIEAYCNDNIYINNTIIEENSIKKNCVQKEKYCYVCCENEFGEFHLDERANCYSTCDDYYIELSKETQTKGFTFKQIENTIEDKIELLKSIKQELSS